MSIDLKIWKPIKNVKFLKGDILEKKTKNEVKNILNLKLDVIII